MNFLELCQTLRREAGVSGTGPASVTGQSGEYLRLINWINQAWSEIQQLRPDWRFMWAQGSFTTAAGIADYTGAAMNVEADNYDLGSFVLTDSLGGKRPMAYACYRDWKEAYGAATLTNNTPHLVTDLPNGSIRFTAPPDGAYPVTFDYYRSPQTLVDNTDEPWLPARYHMLIVHKAMMYYAGYESAPEVLQDATLRWNPLYDAMESTQLPHIGFGHTPLGNDD